MDGLVSIKSEMYFLSYGSSGEELQGPFTQEQLKEVIEDGYNSSNYEDMEVICVSGTDLVVRNVHIEETTTINMVIAGIRK